MNYRGFTIIKSCGQWKVRVSFSEEWLAIDEHDARKQVDEYLARAARKLAA